jgi:hypothetical protein
MPFRAIAALLLGGLLAFATSINAFAETTVKSPNKGVRFSGTQSYPGGGGAGAPLAKPKKKMLNPQPEPPGKAQIK